MLRAVETPLRPGPQADWSAEAAMESLIQQPGDGLRSASSASQSRVNLDPDKVEQGLMRLVLTLIEFVRKLLERQALARMEAGSLTDEEIERIGLALMRLSDKMEDLKQLFELEDADLNLDLGPLGRLM